MATLIVRNVPDHLRDALKDRAHANKRSMEAELRAIIAETVDPDSNWATRFLASAEEFRREFGGVDLDELIGPRTDMGREPIDFS